MNIQVVSKKKTRNENVKVNMFVCTRCGEKLGECASASKDFVRNSPVIDDFLKRKVSKKIVVVLA